MTMDKLWILFGVTCIYVVTFIIIPYLFNFEMTNSWMSVFMILGIPLGLIIMTLLDEKYEIGTDYDHWTDLNIR